MIQKWVLVCVTIQYVNIHERLECVTAFALPSPAWRGHEASQGAVPGDGRPEGRAG